MSTSHKLVLVLCNSELLTYLSSEGLLLPVIPLEQADTTNFYPKLSLLCKVHKINRARLCFLNTLISWIKQTQVKTVHFK